MSAVGPSSPSSADAVADIEPSRPRFVVGIDLGTTNSAICFVDTAARKPSIATFHVPQIIGPGEVAKFETLPSFHYEGESSEVASGSFKLPWSSSAPTIAVGVFARDHGRTQPGRLIESAKSWLCHNGVDRRAALLPWQSVEGVTRLSPVEASSRYLGHLRSAWNHEHPDDPLEQQDVVLTIPASFDEIARELTVTAARQAGLTKLALIEEPQAAFYSWVDAHRANWDRIVQPGQLILVCDIGGGTTDFSLIHVRSGDDGRVRFHRVAVGDHLLLGGDNLDLTLAHFVEQALLNERGLTLSPRQWSQLIPACRHAKEVLLSESAPDSHTLVIAGAGSKLIGGAVSFELTRSVIEPLLLNGFLPEVEVSAKPQRRQSGFREFGLPFAPDAAITRYLAAFLTAHGEAGKAARPDAVLFNGGFFASSVLRSQLVQQLQRWFARNEQWTPTLLSNDRLDLAVARGAAYFGMVRRGVGERIVAGLPRSCYVGIEQSDGTSAAVCLVPAGLESGSAPIQLDRTFRIRTSEPVEFPLFVSTTRLNDRPGDVVALDPEQMTSLPPIRTVLTSRGSGPREIDARLSVAITEIGTLDLWCQQVDDNRRWQLQFDVRSATEMDRAAHIGIGEQSGIVDCTTIEAAAVVIRNVFSSGACARPDELMRMLGEAIGLPRGEWSASLLRAMHVELLEHRLGRQRSAQHEARWLNLTGYCLRPGFGMAADDWRVEETWKVIQGRLTHGVPACLAELRTLCRRLAGGFTAGRQKQIASSIMPAIRQRVKLLHVQRGRSVAYASGNHEAAEIWRMLGSFELLPVAERLELGKIGIDLLNHSDFDSLRPALIWMLGRIGSRVPVYAPLNQVIPVDAVESWIDTILRTTSLTDPGTQLAIMQVSRRTNDRFRDVTPTVRDRVISHLRSCGADEHFIELVEVGGMLDAEESNRVAGESLPSGLRLV